MMSLSENTVQRTFMWNVNEKTGKCNDPKSIWVSYCIQNGTAREGPRGQVERLRTSVLNRPRFKARVCSFWAAQHWTNYCHDFTPGSPQPWHVSSSTDAVEVLWWFNNTKRTWCLPQCLVRSRKVSFAKDLADSEAKICDNDFNSQRNGKNQNRTLREIKWNAKYFSHTGTVFLGICCLHNNTCHFCKTNMVLSEII